MMSATPWLYYIPRSLSFVFLLAALISVSLRRGDGSRAKSLAIIGLGVFLTLQVSDILIPGLIAQHFSSMDFSPVYLVYYVSASLLSITGYSFLIAAIFAGRKANAADIPRHFGGAGVSDDNPYSASSL